MKYVENYWVEELPNGVIHLLINCTQREIYFHNYSDYGFVICGSEEEYDDWGKDCLLKTKSFLPILEEGIYLVSSHKEKDQISYYYIPHMREWVKTKKDRMLVDIQTETENLSRLV